MLVDTTVGCVVERDAVEGEIFPTAAYVVGKTDGDESMVFGNATLGEDSDTVEYTPNGGKAYDIDDDIEVVSPWEALVDEDTGVAISWRIDRGVETAVAKSDGSEVENPVVIPIGGAVDDDPDIDVPDEVTCEARVVVGSPAFDDKIDVSVNDESDDRTEAVVAGLEDIDGDSGAELNDELDDKTEAVVAG